MSALPDIQFGIDWRRYNLNTLALRHQACAYHNAGNGAAWHRKERIKILWPDYQWHRWNERRLAGLCSHRWVTWLGPAASGKSTDAAVFALEYWLQAPEETAVLVCSTTMDMLKSRIWGFIARYHQKLPQDQGNVGTLIDSKTRILWNPGDHINGIFGKAVEEGPVDEIVNNLIGYHTKRVLLVLDEMQGIREAIMQATFNMVANPVFSMLGMGNPDGLQNPLGRESEPVDGWDSVIEGETEHWETHGGPTKGHGLSQFYDGRKSPADDSEAERKRLPFLCNREWFDGILKGARGNMNDPRVWQMGIGWPPPRGLESTLLDDSILTKFKCKAPPVWTEGFTQCAALDPAYSGGDKAILQFLKRGMVADGDGRRWQIAFGEWMEVPIDIKSPLPIHYQIVEFVSGMCQMRKVPPRELAIDASGEGGGLLAIFQKEWGPVVGVEAGGSPSDLPIDETGKTAREAYDNRSSELCFSVREFALANSLRGLSNEAARQGCNRRTFYRNGKWCVEPKTGSKQQKDERGRPLKGYKQRLGHSPDHLDACAVGVEHCRQQGAIPLATGPGKTVANDNWTKLVSKTSRIYDESNYASPELDYEEMYGH